MLPGNRLNTIIIKIPYKIHYKQKGVITNKRGSLQTKGGHCKQVGLALQFGVQGDTYRISCRWPCWGRAWMAQESDSTVVAVGTPPSAQEH